MRKTTLIASVLLPCLACGSGATVDAGPTADPCRGAAFDGAWVADPQICVRVAVQDPSLQTPRGFAFASNGDLFVVDRGAESIRVFWDANRDGVSDASESGTFAAQPGLNHGIAFSPDGAYVYASSDTTVYRWRYSSGDRRAASAPETVVSGIPGGGNHPTRTLLFDGAGRLYVSVGSAHNVDVPTVAPDPANFPYETRAQVRRFTIPAAVPAGGLDYVSGEVFAAGLRNEVGLALDSMGRIWGVQNGRDELKSDANADIHDDNPAERLDLLADSGTRFYGYPFCWAEWMLPGGGGAGTMHADRQTTGRSDEIDQLPAALQATDAWCRDPANARPPAFAMPSHWAPLGVTEYTGSVFPADWRGDLLVTAHGSWDRSPASGHVIARADVRADGTVAGVTPIVGTGTGAAPRMDDDMFRPVDIHQGPDGAVYFTDDQGHRVFRVGYR